MAPNSEFHTASLQTQGRRGSNRSRRLAPELRDGLDCRWSFLPPAQASLIPAPLGDERPRRVPERPPGGRVCARQGSLRDLRAPGRSGPREPLLVIRMTRLKLIGLLTTAALFALPVAPALANHAW